MTLYLTTRGSSPSVRYYFQPRSVHRAKGWTTLRLHDAYEQPIRCPKQAAQACQAIAAIYQAWTAGDPTAGPQCIDQLGRVVAADARTKRPLQRRYNPGQIGDMVASYLQHPRVTQHWSDRTHTDYRQLLRIFVEKFGDRDWRKLTAGTVENWLYERAETNGKGGANTLYRTIRAFYGAMHRVYDDPDHPGYIPMGMNPMAKLRIRRGDKPPILIWPRAAQDAFVALADAEGFHSISDAVILMSWLGARKQDWMRWPANFFDGPVAAFKQRKTKAPNLLPWRQVPELAARVDAAHARLAARLADLELKAHAELEDEKRRRRNPGADRRRKMVVYKPTTFFYDECGQPWTETTLRDCFNALRATLAAKHPFFPTSHWVGLIADQPMAMPTRALAIRALRHTCVTRQFDAGLQPDEVASITGHTTEEVSTILAHYRARTAEQAGLALKKRMDFEDD